MKRVLACLLVAALALSFAVVASADEKAATTVTASDTVEFNKDDVAKLTDGKTDEAVVFTNKADDAATIEISFDLGEVKTLSAVEFTCADNTEQSELEVSVSLDGKDYYVMTGEKGSLGEGVIEGGNPITTKFGARIAVNARYVKAKLTFTNKTLSISEVTVKMAEDGVTNFNPDHVFGYTTDGTVQGAYYTALFKEKGEYTLNGSEHPKALVGCQITVATWDDTVKAYKIRFNECNLWDTTINASKHATESVTLADNEILLAISTRGNISKDSEDDTTYAAAKIIMRGLKEGDWIVLDEKVKTYQMFPASHDFTKADTPTDEPTESTPTESTPTESTPTSSDKPAAGDSGMLVFAVLGVLSVAGVAVAVKTRR